MQTSIAPSEASGEQTTLPPSPSPQPRNFQPPPPVKPPNPEGSPLTASASPQVALPLAPLPGPWSPKPKEPPQLNSAICQIDLRTPAEELEFQDCEAIVRESWTHIAQAGEALTTIRDKRLYKNEYASFEDYCRERWGFGRGRACQYIAAAEVQKNLATIPGLPAPESEGQIRPLIGLPADQAQAAWLKALSWTGDNHVPARLVKRAAKQVLRTEQPAAVAESNAERKQRSRLRQSVRAGFQELLALLLGSAERAVLIAKVQEIQRLLDPLMAPKKTKL